MGKLWFLYKTACLYLAFILITVEILTDESMPVDRYLLIAGSK